MIDKHIEIVSSTKSYLSSMSQPSRQAIREVLAKYYTKVGITLVDEVSDLQALVAKSPDLVFLGMKFVPIDSRSKQNSMTKVWLSDYLEDRGITCTGSGSSAHQLELDKPQAKLRVADRQLATAPFQVVRMGQRLRPGSIELDYPLFVKPTNRGGGLGVDEASLVEDFAQLQVKTESITVKYQSDSLVERYLPGREFSVAVLRDLASGELSAMPIELIPDLDSRGVRMLSGSVKSANSEQVALVDDPAVLSQVRRLARQAFCALGARDYGRIDIRFDQQGQANFLEANLIPSLIAGYGSFPKACWLNQSIEYEQVLLRIVQLALERRPVAVNLPQHDSLVA